MSPEKPIVRRKWFNIELLLGISATLLSLCALVVSIFQTNLAREQNAIAREQQQASVWPHIQAVYSQNNDDFGWTIINNGVGPAIVKSLTLTYQGKAYKDAHALV